MLIQDIKRPQTKPKKPVRIAGKVTETIDGRVEIIFRVNGNFYKYTPTNTEAINAYLHTGNVEFLKYLENNSDVTIGGNRG